MQNDETELKKGSGQNARATVARASCPEPNKLSVRLR